MNNLNGNRSTTDRTAGCVYDIGSKTQFLTPSGKSKTKYICPVCGGKHLDINPPKYACFTNECDSQAIRTAIDKLEGKHPDDWKKPKIERQTSEYFYPDREGEPLVKVVRQDNGEGKKRFYQNHWGGHDWKKGNPQGVRAHIPIYRYLDVRAAIDRQESIWIVEGEKAADILWTMNIAATTTIGGSAGYSKYGDYRPDLAGAKLILCPDRDEQGLKYIRNFERDFPDQIGGYYLAGTQDFWPRLQGGMDIVDDINDYRYQKTDLEFKVITPAQFEALLETQPIDFSPEPAKEKRATADRLIDLVMGVPGIELFHTPSEEAYVDVSENGIRKTLPIRRKAFRDWIKHQYYCLTNKSAGSEATQQAIDTLQAIAIHEGAKQEVYLRIAELNNRIYIDLGSDTWQSIEVSSDGWRIISDAPVRFRRHADLLPLPIPIGGGSLDTLKNMLNLQGRDWTMVSTWLLNCFKPAPTYPILILHGEAGSGKTTLSAVLKRLIDPGKAPLIPAVGDTRNLAIAANNRYVVGYDNLSGLSAEQSDCLCRIATGGGFSHRTLHSDLEETTIEFVRPQILNGIDSLATRGDLLDRSILVQVAAPVQRSNAAELWAKFEVIHPQVFGAILDTLSQGLRCLPEVNCKNLPRMADYATFSIAVEGALGLETGEFLAAYEGVREEAHETALDASPIGQAILVLMAEDLVWEGTTDALLQKLASLVDEKVRRSRVFPADPIRLSKALTRIAPDLRGVGIGMEYVKSNGRRLIILNRNVK
jgi:hypothetical protein